MRPPAAAAQGSDRNAPSISTANSDEGSAQNGQDSKLAFVNASVDRRTVSPDRVTRPASPYIVQAGTVIPGALITGIRSDLPGQITAQVTESVFDTPTGRLLLIPQGARLIGVYDSQVAFGQSRVLLVWTRLIMPNGRSIVLERQPGADAAGYSGLEDEVDNHWGELFKAAALSTLLAVGTELGAGSDTNSNDSAIIQALRHGAGNSLNQTGQQVVRRSLNIQPTLTIRPGFPGPRYRQSRSRSRAIQRVTMTKLKIGALPDESQSRSALSCRLPCIEIWSLTQRPLREKPGSRSAIRVN